MSKKSLNLEGIVIKRKNLGETDRLITLVCQEKGKLGCVAKGVRRLNSSSRAALEPGNLVRAQLIITKGLPLLVQARLISDAAAARGSLPHIRQLAQILEVFDKLLVEEEIPQSSFELICDIRSDLLNNKTQLIRAKLTSLLQALGFADHRQRKEETVLEYIQQIVQRPMRGFEYLHLESNCK